MYIFVSNAGVHDLKSGRERKTRGDDTLKKITPSMHGEDGCRLTNPDSRGFHPPHFSLGFRPEAVFDILLAFMLNRRYPQNISTDFGSPLAGGIQDALPNSNPSTPSSPEYLTAPVFPSSPLPSAPIEAARAEPTSTSFFQWAKDFELNDCNFYDIVGDVTFNNNYASVKYPSFSTLHCSNGSHIRTQL
jgi:hypothetical protein